VLLAGAVLRPLPGTLLSTFGRSRFINGEQRSPHTGLDLRAAVGEPVLASNSGRLHWWGLLLLRSCRGGRPRLGLYTMYFHLSEVKVKKGGLVERGR